MMVDDDAFDLMPFTALYKNIHFIKVNKDLCQQAGYMNTNYFIGKVISGWDKVLYYFGMDEDKYEDKYDFIWLIEDDVFFYAEQTLARLDNNYATEDLLANRYYTNPDGNKQTWNWAHVTLSFAPPYYRGMMCAVRFSKKMMGCIKQYARDNGTLTFLEALFPTVAIKRHLNYATPIEMADIHYRYNFVKKAMDANSLYHPIKNMYTHVWLRQQLYRSNAEKKRFTLSRLKSAQ